MGLLDGKNILIAGVANDKSIAWGIARSLREHGAVLAFSCIESNMRRVTKLAKQVDSSIIIPCNVQNDADITGLFQTLNTSWPKLDGLVHSLAFAKLDDLGGDIVNTSRDGFNLAMDVSAYSLIAMCRGARPMMKAAGGGSIVTLTFMGGIRVCPGYNVMGIAKAALNMTARYLAYYLGPDQIRLNILSPAPIRTISASAVEGIEDGLRDMEEKSPLRKNIGAEDVGGATVYLMSDLSKCVSAELMHVDCGFNVMRP